MRRLYSAVYLLCALVCLSAAHLPLNTGFEGLMDALWAKEECEKFASHQNWTIIAASECVRRKCNYPREMCVEHMAMAFSDKGRKRRCLRVPKDCYRAVFGDASDSAASFQESEPTLHESIDSDVLYEQEVGHQQACSQPWDSGTTCRSNMRGYQYFFDGRLGYCTRMPYLGCGGNGNRFATLQECISRCGARRSGRLDNASKSVLESDQYRPPRCRMEKLTGHQNCAEAGLRRKFYFDQRAGDCNMFFWAGCQGNNNRFDSIDECRSVCRV
uniref:BPTI/Kunitz inhibitor domain-containing protein n=1 Tax=Plectus sambesii TaxID=2011161 RepID=A0A914WJ14_9BILA